MLQSVFWLITRLGLQASVGDCQENRAQGGSCEPRLLICSSLSIPPAKQMKLIQQVFMEHRLCLTPCSVLGGFKVTNKTDVDVVYKVQQ